MSLKDTAEAELLPQSSSLLGRLRRMGLLLTGDQALADAILREAFLRARAAFARGDNVSEEDIFKLGFDAFDNAVKRRGIVVILNRKRSRGGGLGATISELEHDERIALSLLVMEDIELKDAAILSGRPAWMLERSLASAVSKLERSEDIDDE